MIDFTPVKGIKYKYDYPAIFKDIAKGNIHDLSAYHSLILNDLFFIVYFVMEVPIANHKFVVEACKEVESGPKSFTLDVWAREHFKTTILTKAETIQEILKNPEERMAIISHTRSAAKAFLRSIKVLFETSELLQACFPEILYKNPQNEATKWSEDDGLCVKRSGSPTEQTLEAWGLIEGMPTGRHFTKIKYDDIMTQDYVSNPEVIRNLIYMFDLSQNLGTNDGTHRVIGTFYHHKDVLVYIMNKRDPITDELQYITRKKAATEDGTAQGKPVFLTQSRLNKLKSNPYIFNCQQLLDPSPVGDRPLESKGLSKINRKMVPKNIYKFMIIDPAGDAASLKKGYKGNKWAYGVIGVEPKMDEVGASNCYIMDLFASQMSESEAIEMAVRMYTRNGVILMLGIEQSAQSKDHVHIVNALRARGRYVSEENNSLMILRTNTSKRIRIASALSWPLNNNKWYICDDIDETQQDNLISEMDNFPVGDDDTIDMISYLYTILKDYPFPSEDISAEPFKQMNVGVIT